MRNLNTQEEYAASSSRNVRYETAHLLYVPITLGACILAAAISYFIIGQSYRITGIALTFLFLAFLMLLMAPAIKSIPRGTLVCVELACILFIGHSIKIALMKAPILAADLETIPLLLRTASGRYLFIALTIIAMILGTFVLSFRLQIKSLKPMALGATYIILLLSFAPSINRLIPSIIDNTSRESGAFNTSSRRIDTLLSLGPPLYLLSDWVQFRSDIGMIPDKKRIHALSPVHWSGWKTRSKRNVHIVLLESLWDTSVLKNIQINRHPWDPRFLALWESAGKPHALSPVFGGSTANAEFEALCALVAPGNSVAFQSSLINPAPCLPAAFAQMGYLTTASHPHDANNWNRDHAYPRLGFQRYHPIDAFELDDLDQSYLSDASFFRQNLKTIDSNSTTQPVFNYLVSLSSHWAYGRNKTARPDIISISPHEPRLLKDYLNASAYTTSAFMDWATHVLKNDPHALIIAFGDHAPVLDAEPDIYASANSSDRGEFDSDATRKLVGLTRTPLLIIDGDAGPVAVPKAGGRAIDQRLPVLV